MYLGRVARFVKLSETKNAYCKRKEFAPLKSSTLKGNNLPQFFHFFE